MDRGCCEGLNYKDESRCQQGGPPPPFSLSSFAPSIAGPRESCLLLFHLGCSPFSLFSFPFLLSRTRLFPPIIIRLVSLKTGAGTVIPIARSFQICLLEVKIACYSNQARWVKLCDCRAAPVLQRRFTRETLLSHKYVCQKFGQHLARRELVFLTQHPSIFIACFQSLF